jgi:hypothetical protein
MIKRLVLKITLLLNSARSYGFQKFIVPRKIHISQKIILSSVTPPQDALNGAWVAYVFFMTSGSYDRVKDDVEDKENC